MLNHVSRGAIIRKRIQGRIDKAICLKHRLRIGLFVFQETEEFQNDSPQKSSSTFVDMVSQVLTLQSFDKVLSSVCLFYTFFILQDNYLPFSCFLLTSLSREISLQLDFIIFYQNSFMTISFNRFLSKHRHLVSPKNNPSHGLNLYSIIMTMR